jgi:hypothetical protein
MSGHGFTPANRGFNQSGGSYFITLASLVGSLQTLTPGTGSGGATTTGTITPYSVGSGLVAAGTAAESLSQLSNLVGTGRIILDMGRTVVSSGRTFRKFQAVNQLATTTAVVNGAAPNAVTGANPGATVTSGTSSSTGYLTFYLETGFNGTSGTTTSNSGFGLPAPIARYA